MEDWKTDWNRDVLERIVALLFALANLADLAAGAPFLRRRRVLGILREGEAEARAFVIGISTGSPAPSEVPESAEDAACLAMRFRALALLLCAILVQPKLSARPSMAGQRGGRSKLARQAGHQALPLVPDTS